MDQCPGGKLAVTNAMSAPSFVSSSSVTLKHIKMCRMILENSCETVNMSSKQRLGQTVPRPPRVRSLGAAQLEGLARVLHYHQPRVQTGLAEVVAAYHLKLHSDLEETKSAVISASELPLSLIIVGVGRRLQEYERSG